ncbi:MAG TPA: alpha-L-arabinofuranosidase C-terminal domain-containing protein [Acidisarcina sp.]|nr:alpha-L-arabinofuranosidase C-terminal domain-containing protein [Acidisarcina sp.]
MSWQHALSRSAVLLCLPLAAALYAQQVPASQNTALLEVHLQKPTAKVSPMLYGLMTEEINYSYDGGLYGELVSNRSLSEKSWMGPPHWLVVQKGDSLASIELDKANGPSAALTNSLKLIVRKADAGNPAGVENDGFWGFPVRARTTFQGSLYAKADSASVGSITVSLVSNDTGRVAASAVVPAPASEWKKYDFELKTGEVATSSAYHLLLSVEHPGSVWFDLVSLFPPTYHNRQNGNRIDLMEKMAAMKPTFLRLPGGNYLEGNHISERYDWKKTIGPLVDRPTHPSPWNYHSSDGMGLLEFLEWCEDLRIQPVLAVYAGYSLMGEHVNPGTDLQPYVQDALDEIEYVTGSTSTTWGAVRAKNGHPQPFPLTYVEIGNEDWFDKSGSYDERYAQFYKAIKKQYPSLQLIATTPVKGITPDVIDDHYYKHAVEFYDDVHHYDKTDRNGPKIFVGEWATREGSPTPNFGAALGDAAWMTGMERNSDIIVMASYAPLLVNVNPGGMQWESDLIGYDALTSYGSPSYYAQVMFGSHIGTEVLDSRLDGAGPRIFYSVTHDPARGLLILKLVNGSSIPQPLEIKLAGATQVKPTATLVSLSAHTTEETNSISDPTRIVPIQSTLKTAGADFHHVIPGYSIQVLELSVK